MVGGIYELVRHNDGRHQKSYPGSLIRTVFQKMISCESSPDLQCSLRDLQWLKRVRKFREPVCRRRGSHGQDAGHSFRLQ
ncbi:unnamed protein product [Calypogeia fissa]